jgi:hypothetical protein
MADYDEVTAHHSPGDTPMTRIHKTVAAAAATLALAVAPAAAQAAAPVAPAKSGSTAPAQVASAKVAAPSSGPSTHLPTERPVAQTLDAGSAGVPGWDDARCEMMAAGVNALTDMMVEAYSRGDDKTAASYGEDAAEGQDVLEDNCLVVY